MALLGKDVWYYCSWTLINCFDLVNKSLCNVRLYFIYASIQFLNNMWLLVVVNKCYRTTCIHIVVFISLVRALSVCVCVCTRVFVCVRMCVCVLCVVSVCMCVCMCLCVCLCVYMSMVYACICHRYIPGPRSKHYFSSSSCSPLAPPYHHNHWNPLVSLHCSGGVVLVQWQKQHQRIELTE